MYNRFEPYNALPVLPRQTEQFDLPEILKILSSAARWMGELNGLCTSLPDPNLLINTIVLQESRDSLAIENIVTTQDELYQAATEIETATPSAKEVLSYREALYTGLNRMVSHQNLLMINGMIEIVQTVKQNKAGIRNTPGTSLKNAVSNEVVYTPPCCEDVIREKLAELERFINEENYSDIHPMIKMALIHYQFEAIHPFADGNGRVGRIINSLYLVQQQLLSQPVLYLSSYIIKHKTEYYELLRGVTENNNWKQWVMFMLTGIVETAKATAQKIRNIIALKATLEKELRTALGSSYTHDLLELMFRLPYVKIELLERTGLAHRQTASTWLKKLSAAGILRPQKSGRTTYYVNYRLMELL